MKTIQTERREGSLLIVLNRPEYRNAVNYEMMDELQEALIQAKEDPNIKTIIFTGVDRSFSSGGDLGQFHQLKTKEDVRPMLEKMGKVIAEIVHLGKPTIAYINGYALGGGAELAMACDIRYINRQAKMGFIQINLGVTSGWGGGTLLIEKLGKSKGLSILLSGDILTAEEILGSGIAEKEVASFDDVLLFAEKINSHSLQGIQSYIELANGINAGKTFYENQKGKLNHVV
ncbi:enoyl-CoA hydratase/isomerase family protein [Tepidibacillus marianensis]|uniref:enoyl-CoA hydratase/isomerase family protein n=1 Tax=Tepidibacillus marianensis TaxID=3131995 RepID=UPI0030CFCC1C